MCDECDVLDTLCAFKHSKYDDQSSLFINIKNRPASAVDLLGKGLRDDQIYSI